MRKKILVYGDSNTWGDNFLTGKRIDEEKQWVNILRKKYHQEYVFFQEGLPGRLAGNEETVKKYKNGQDTFVATFKTNAPVDEIIISLGTNDLQLKYQRSSEKIIQDLLWYEYQLEEIFSDMEDREKYFNGIMPKIIYILPVNFDYQNNAKEIFDAECEKKRQEIIEYFEKKNRNLVVSNDIELLPDGIHLSDKGHETMAELVEKVL